MLFDVDVVGEMFWVCAVLGFYFVKLINSLCKHNILNIRIQITLIPILILYIFLILSLLHIQLFFFFSPSLFTLDFLLHNLYFITPRQKLLLNLLLLIFILKTLLGFHFLFCHESIFKTKAILLLHHVTLWLFPMPKVRVLISMEVFSVQSLEGFLKEESLEFK